MGYVVAIDETKAKRFVMVAAGIPAERAQEVRRDLGSLVMPGQRSLHMQSEGDRRRRRILDLISEMSVSGLIRVSVYDAGRSGNEYDQRRRCLRAIVADQTASREVQLLIDLDVSREAWDRQTLIEERRARAAGFPFRYEHRRRTDDHLLAVPDAIAWSWNRGGEWRRKASAIVHAVRDLGQ